MTSIIIKAYSKLAPENLTKVSADLKGQWTHVRSSEISLSCSILFNQAKKSIGLIAYSKEKKSIKLLGVIALTSFTQQSNLTTYDLRKMFKVGEHCRTLKFQTPNLTAFYRANANWTTLVLIALPPGARLQASSKDLTYLVLNNILYRYN